MSLSAASTSLASRAVVSLEGDLRRENQSDLLDWAHGHRSEVTGWAKDSAQTQLLSLVPQGWSIDVGAVSAFVSQRGPKGGPTTLIAYVSTGWQGDRPVLVNWSPDKKIKGIALPDAVMAYLRAIFHDHLTSTLPAPTRERNIVSKRNSIPQGHGVILAVLGDLQSEPELQRILGENLERYTNFAASVLADLAPAHVDQDLLAPRFKTESIDKAANIADLNNLDKTGQRHGGWAYPINAVVRLLNNPRRYIVISVDTTGQLELRALSGAVKSGKVRGHHHLSQNKGPRWVLDADQTLSFSGPDAAALQDEYIGDFRWYNRDNGARALRVGDFEPAALVALARERLYVAPKEGK
jgi:hypothetical protein